MKVIYIAVLFLLSLLFITPAFPALATDPTYGWTKVAGGTANKDIEHVTTDPSGNVYMTGKFSGTVDFNPGVGIDNKTAVGSENVFLTKINADGSYGWTKTMGGTGAYSYGYGVATDSSGNIFVTGEFNQTIDFNPDAGVDNKTAPGSYNYFLTKINADGSYGWTKVTQLNGTNYGKSVTTDPAGNIYLLGVFFATVDFNPDAGVDSRTTAQGHDMFVTKYNADGSYGWTKTMASSVPTDPYPQTITTDKTGHIYATGYFSKTTDFNPGPGDSKTVTGSYNLFLTKYSVDGTYGWTKTVGSTSYDDALGVVTDSSGNIFLTGYFAGTADFDPGPGTDNKTCVGASNSFVTKINSDGSYGWTNIIGGTYYNSAYGISVDSFGNVYSTGYFGGTVDFDPTSGVDNRTAGSSWDDSMYVTGYTSSGAYLWTRTTTGGNESDGYDISIDVNNNLYVMGDVYGTVNFNPSGSADNITGDPSNGGITLTKFTLNASAPTSTPIPTLTPTPTLTAYPTPTPSTAAASVSSSGSSSVDHTPPACNDTVPLAPYLFEIDTSKTTATLFYTPPSSGFNKLYISYGYKPDSLTSGVEVTQLPTPGILKFTINLLKPSTTYYFKLRLGNNCMPGGWSGLLSAQTGTTARLKKFYPGPSITIPLVKTKTPIKTISKLLNPTPVTSLAPTLIPSTPPAKTLNPVLPTPLPLPSKHCLLWWCF